MEEIDRRNGENEKRQVNSLEMSIQRHLDADILLHGQLHVVTQSDPRIAFRRAFPLMMRVHRDHGIEIPRSIMSGFEVCHHYPE